MISYVYVVTKKEKPLPLLFLNKFDENNLIIDSSDGRYLTYYVVNHDLECLENIRY